MTDLMTDLHPVVTDLHLPLAAALHLHLMGKL
jgi:hypothetical protein